MKPFSKFGLEPTYYPDHAQLPAWWFKTNRPDMLIEYFISGLTGSHFSKFIKHKWWQSAHDDEGVLEVNTGVYTKFSDLKKDWKSFEKKIKKISFLPSTLVDMDTEGGCHMNFSLAHLPRKAFTRVKYNDDTEFAYDYRNIFCKNLLTYLSHNPALVWACLSPNDNRSSQIPQQTFDELDPLSRFTMYKGSFLTFRGKRDWSTAIRPKDADSGDHDRVELRFFMMPRDAEELEFHFKYANAILHHVKKLTNTQGYVKVSKKHASLSTYTLPKAIAELKREFEVLGLSYKEYKQLGKEELLAERFSYGKRWLV